jgi:hypothetical protein
MERHLRECLLNPEESGNAAVKTLLDDNQGELIQ